MKKIILSIILTIVLVAGFSLKNSYADQYIYEYRDLGNDMTLKTTYDAEDMRVVEIEVIHEDN